MRPTLSSNKSHASILHNVTIVRFGAQCLLAPSYLREAIGITLQVAVLS